MERDEYLRQFNEVKKEGEFKPRPPDEVRELVRHHMLYLSPPDKPIGHQQLTIAAEELAELIQRITKALRGKYDMVSLTEEFADVIISLYYIEEVLNVNPDDIQIGMEVKLRKIDKLIEEACKRDPNEPMKEEWL